MLYKIFLVDLTELDGKNPGDNETVMLLTNKRNPMLAAKYDENISLASGTNVPVEFLNDVNTRFLKRCQNLEQQRLAGKVSRAICNFLIKELSRILKSASRGIRIYVGLMEHRAKPNMKRSKRSAPSVKFPLPTKKRLHNFSELSFIVHIVCPLLKNRGDGKTKEFCSRSELSLVKIIVFSWFFHYAPQ